MGREEVRAVKLRITDIVCEQFMALRKLGEGGCGVIFEVFNLTRPDEHAACKAELSGRNTDEEILKLEGKVMRLLNEAGAHHVPRCLREGTERNYNYLIMSLLGPSLNDLRKQIPDGKLTLYSCMAVAIQSIDAIKEMHDVGYLHRDVKPSNFTIGLMGTSRERFIYLVDFGLARKFVTSGADGKQELRKKRKSVPFRGTVRYCSLNVHSQEEQGRHDDLWSLVYMLMEMCIGNLPWYSMDREQTERNKIETEHDILQQMPKEMEIIVGHLKNLSYCLTPNYELIRALFCRVIKRDCAGKTKLDWEKGGHHENILRKQALLHAELEKPCAPLADILALHRTEVKLKDDAIPMQSQSKQPTFTNSSIDDTIEAPSSDGGPKKKKAQPPSEREAKPPTTPTKYAYKGKGKAKTPNL